MRLAGAPAVEALAAYTFLFGREIAAAWTEGVVRALSAAAADAACEALLAGQNPLGAKQGVGGRGQFGRRRFAGTRAGLVVAVKSATAPGFHRAKHSPQAPRPAFTFSAQLQDPLTRAQRSQDFFVQQCSDRRR
jgi:hypothetical protein